MYIQTPIWKWDGPALSIQLKMIKAFPVTFKFFPGKPPLQFIYIHVTWMPVWFLFSSMVMLSIKVKFSFLFTSSNSTRSSSNSSNMIWKKIEYFEYEEYVKFLTVHIFDKEMHPPALLWYDRNKKEKNSSKLRKYPGCWYFHIQILKTLRFLGTQQT